MSRTGDFHGGRSSSWGSTKAQACLSAKPKVRGIGLRQDSVCARLWLYECLTAKPEHENRVPRSPR